MTLRVYNIKTDKNIPKNTIYIGRNSPFGNPFIIGIDGDRNEVCNLYIEMIEKDKELKALIKESLKGKNLLCHCKPLRCHGDYLLKIANED